MIDALFGVVFYAAAAAAYAEGSWRARPDLYVEVMYLAEEARLLLRFPTRDAHHVEVTGWDVDLLAAPARPEERARQAGPQDIMDQLRALGADALFCYLVGVELGAALRLATFTYPAPDARYLDLDGEVVVPVAVDQHRDVVRARGERALFDSKRARFARWTRIEARA